MPAALFRNRATVHHEPSVYVRADTVMAWRNRERILCRGRSAPAQSGEYPTGCAIAREVTCRSGRRNGGGRESRCADKQWLKPLSVCLLVGTRFVRLLSREEKRAKRMSKRTKRDETKSGKMHHRVLSSVRTQVRTPSINTILPR